MSLQRDYYIRRQHVLERDGKYYILEFSHLMNE